MSARAVRWLAWLLWALGVGLAIATLLLLFVGGAESSWADVGAWIGDGLFAAQPVVVSTVAVLIVLSHPRNPIGWLMSVGSLVVGSTLGIAALFTPLRRTIQSFVDRRFYRTRYDAAKVVARFSAVARDEVELAPLVDQLREVVQDAMQPAFITLWLRTPPRPGSMR
jgi:hypothetical protein